MDIPHELVGEFARGDGAIFVGAGLSQGVGRTELVERVQCAAGKGQSSVIRAAQEYFASE
jgi:hypothetical protein